MHTILSLMKAVCTNRPDCPCEFCASLRIKHASSLSEKERLDGIAFEWMRDREMDAEMRERQKRDPEFVTGQQRFVAELFTELEPVTPSSDRKNRR
jgi:hypothetical protein